MQWEGNEHYYLVVNQTTNWDEARLLAESMMFMGVPGHLATITSEDENAFVTTQLCNPVGSCAGAWLGGMQLPDSPEPGGGWQWITGEPWMYTKWDGGEPNNSYGGGWGTAIGSSEERLHYHHNGTHWNDLPGDPGVVTPRFIVEWEVSDTDGDGVPDDQDICPGGDDTVDSDNDFVPDFCDPCPHDAENDADGDGVCSDVDTCPGGDDSLNADGDALPDFCDVCPNDPENDADGDGICESNDNCPLTCNANQANQDGDAFGDACDLDNDNDGISDEGDNCPLNANSDQTDSDGDGAGDVCDSDDDNDGVLDAKDECLYTAAGVTVNTNGCSIADLCPCVNEKPWKNHGAYVSCVAHAAEDFMAAGLITEAAKDAIVEEAAHSNCGSKK
jgi:hypothetical protein